MPLKSKGMLTSNKCLRVIEVGEVGLDVEDIHTAL